jgi:outer membrane immunogenic protein
MKRFALAAGTAAAALLVTSPAAAQDLNFQGPYIGGTIGMAFQGDNDADSLVFDTDQDGDFGDMVNTAEPADAFGPGFCAGTANSAVAADGCEDDDNELEYAIRAGYDGRPGGGSFLAGVLFEASKSEGTDTTTGFSTTPASYTTSRELDYALSLRGRLGFVAGENFLIYGTGGASYAKIDHGFATTNGANSFTQVNDDEMAWGWQGGGGVEMMLGSSLSLGIEYLFNRYDDDDYYVAVGAGTAPPTNPFLLVSGGTNLRPSDTDFEFQTLRATVSFHF